MALLPEKPERLGQQEQRMVVDEEAFLPSEWGPPSASYLEAVPHTLQDTAERIAVKERLRARAEVARTAESTALETNVAWEKGRSEIRTARYAALMTELGRAKNVEEGLETHDAGAIAELALRQEHIHNEETRARIAKNITLTGIGSGLLVTGVTAFEGMTGGSIGFGDILYGASGAGLLESGLAAGASTALVGVLASLLSRLILKLEHSKKERRHQDAYQAIFGRVRNLSAILR